MIEPITPAEAQAQKKTIIPDFVLKTVNDLIIRRLNGGKAAVKQSEITAVLIEQYGHSLTTILEKHWLDFEDAYEAAGWHVKYDKPAWNEDGTAIFYFTAKE